MTTHRQARPREVVNVVTDKQLMRQGSLGQIGGGHIEIVQKRDGSWQVFYPEEGFIPDSPGSVRPMTLCSWATSEDPYDFDTAMKIAEGHANGREIKVLMYSPGRRKKTDK